MNIKSLSLSSIKFLFLICLFGVWFLGILTEGWRYRLNVAGLLQSNFPGFTHEVLGCRVGPWSRFQRHWLLNIWLHLRHFHYCGFHERWTLYFWFWVSWGQTLQLGDNPFLLIVADTSHTYWILPLAIILHHRSDSFMIISISLTSQSRFCWFI